MAAQGGQGPDDTLLPPGHMPNNPVTITGPATNPDGSPLGQNETLQQLSDAWYAASPEGTLGNFLGGAATTTAETIALGALLGGGEALLAPAAGAGAGAGGAVADAGVVGGAGALDAPVTAGDIGALTSGAATIAPEAGAGASLPADLGIAGGTGAVGASADAATLPELTVTGTSLAGAGAPASDLLSGIGPIATAGLPTALSGAPAGDLAPAQGGDFSTASASNTSPGVSTDTPNFLQASDTSPSLTPMSSDLMSQLGIDPSTLGDSFSADASTLGDVNPGYGPLDIQGPNGAGLSGWLSNPKNLATLGSLGISGMSAFRQPALPAASKTAAGNAQTVAAGALPVIQSGGTAGPQWASQKASIDATIDNEIKQQSAAIQQAAANSGEGNQNSGIVQQQIAAMTQQANLQRQQMYTQVQQQNVNNAIAELSGSDALLAQIGNLQFTQEERAQQLAAQTAQLALRLYSSSGVPAGP